MALVSVLRNVDLVSSIIQYTNSSKDLASLSLTSHTFSSIALDYLWRELPTAYYILKLLNGFTLVDDRYTITRPPTDIEWSQFDRYSRRIQKIACLFATSPYGVRIHIDPHIFNTLHEFRPEIPLFPSLRALKMPKHIPNILSQGLVIMPLMTSMMLKIHLFTFDLSAKHYLERLYKIGSQLRRIRINGRHSLALTRTVIDFRHLEFLDLNFHWTPDYFEVDPKYPDYPALLNQLSELDSLSSFLITPPQPLNSKTLSTTGFRNLKRLAITGDIQSFSSICRMASRIEYLVVEMSSSEYHAKWQSFFEVIQMSCPLLKDIRIHGRYDIEEISMSVLKHLEPMRTFSLTGLCIKSNVPIRLELSDADVGEIATFWPGLVHLKVFADCVYMTPNIPSIKGVRAILQACDELRYLRMSCDNKALKLSTFRNIPKAFTLDNTYPPFTTFV